MEIPNLKITNSQLCNYKTSFKGEADNTVSKPINAEIKPEIVSKEYADATKATAMAQIMSGVDLKAGMTYMDYVDKLMKQGKIPTKDFNVKTTEAGLNYVEELNQKGEKIKEVAFFEDGIGCKFYNPKNQKVYKTLESHNGKLYISNNNVDTGEPVLDELYNSDGSLESNAFYKKCEKGETSINGDYKITGIGFVP